MGRGEILAPTFTGVLMKALIVLILLSSELAYGQAYNCKITSQTEFSASTTSVRALDLESARRCLTVQNKGSSTIYIKFNSIHSGTEGIAVTGGGNWEPFIVPINSIWIKSAAGIVTATVLEGQ
jgi:hypothetical protein